MNPINIEEILQKNDHDQFTFMDRIEDPYQLCEQMVAIANGNGGLVVIGLNASGESSQLNQNDIVSAMRMITQASFELVQPSIFPKTQIIDYKDAKSIVIEIPSGYQKPYCTVSGRFLTKKDSDIQEMGLDDLRALFQEKMVTQADQMIIEGLDQEQIDIDIFKPFFQKKYQVDLPDHIPLMTILESMKLASNGRINTTGMLLFGIYPTEEFALSQIIAMAFFGNDTSDLEYRDSETFEGTIPQLFENGFDFIVRNLTASQEENEGLKDIPDNIIQEILINSLVHRSYYMDYFTSGNTVISVFDDRVEIESPGALPENLSIKTIQSGAAFQRNPTIAKYIIDMLPFRGIGLGLSAIVADYPGIEMIDEPDSDQFKVIIKRP
ncbi:MAG: transcriptional regulator [Candidatus Magnetoglobus multicellularis str. Araruama]|uniref:Transcriptional regulator n=1 Tax=Candidatus Magnetoglobus multicellularis str. Araruama TaxID=890399 RepID=A0A1V1PCJ0_9BACT|nr:MAG: transcriptional regulator [Candidatus Magnetoglobus multicellularis str. Araruama]